MSGRFPEPIEAQARLLVAALSRAGTTVVTAESCTGGLIAACLTEIPGSSAVLDRGIVAYCNKAKCELLGVPATLLEQHGAVSAPVAKAMAEGALAGCAADLAVAVTGIAGPDGGSADKPVGLVYTACARRDGPVEVVRRVHPGDRDAVRLATVAEALALLARHGEVRP